jgi:putative restriction endonuclease
MAIMRGYVAVTDTDWYEFLSARPELTEVNFWRPRSKNRFAALNPGEFFFFKLKAAEGNPVVGGIFADWEPSPLSVAWEFYREGNGAASLDELRRLIAAHTEIGLR